MTTGLGLPGPLPILVPKGSCPRKLLSPRQPGHLVTLLCSRVLDHEPPLGPWLTRSMVYVFVKLDQSPSLSLGFWMLNWEKHTETRSCLQHYYIKCSPLEQCHIDCTLKSPETLKPYSWVGLGSQNWFNWFEMGPAYGTLKQSYLMVLRCSQSPQSTALKKRFTNSLNFQYRGFRKCLVFCYFWSLLIQQLLGFHKILQYLSSKSV